jgi:hypothetical protein
MTAFDTQGRRKRRSALTQAEQEFWQNQAALLDPAAFTWVIGASFSAAIPSGEIGFLMSAWNASLNGTGQIYLRDPRAPLPLPGGTTVRGTTNVGSFAYYCRPAVVVATDTRYTDDPKGLYYARLARLQQLTLYSLDLLTPAAANQLYTVAFPPDFTAALIVGAQCYDASWVGLRDSGAAGSLPLGPEVSDSHEFRWGAAYQLPFLRATFPSLSARNGQIAPSVNFGGTSDLNGNVSVQYVVLPSDW